MPAQCCKDLFNRIPDDVPVFTLVAYDELSSDVILYWLKKAEIANVNPDKLKRSRERFEDFLKFRREHPDRMKLPD